MIKRSFAHRSAFLFFLKTALSSHSLTRAKRLVALLRRSFNCILIYLLSQKKIFCCAKIRGSGVRRDRGGYSWYNVASWRRARHFPGGSTVTFFLAIPIMLCCPYRLSGVWMFGLAWILLLPHMKSCLVHNVRAVGRLSNFPCSCEGRNFAEKGAREMLSHL